jgi:hypothetical protein
MRAGFTTGTAINTDGGASPAVRPLRESVHAMLTGVASHHNQVCQRVATAPAAPAMTTALLRFIRRTARGDVNRRRARPAAIA